MAFLRQHHPFSELDDGTLDAIRTSLEIVHVPAGEVILTEGGAAAEALGLIRKGELELSTGAVVVDLLEPGDVFGLTSVMTGQTPTMTVRAVEDSLCYLLPADAARRALANAQAMTSVWAIARQRVRAADAAARTVRDADPRFARIGTLVRREPVTIEADATVAEAAARMRDERVSALLIRMGEDWAIVTDRDLRTRIVAERGSFDRPVAQIATSPVHVAPADTLAGEATLRMLELDIHHLPVVAHGRVVGVITVSDLLDLDRGSPFAIRSAISHAPTVNEVVFAARGFPSVVAALVEAGGDPIDIGRIVSVIADAATVRLLALATDEMGELPCAFAWLSLGSAARHERALHSDQDHAIAFGPGFRPAEHDAAFAALAESVTAGLESIGFPRCHGDAMAVHPAMRQPLEGWAERFRTWIHQPDADAMILSSIVFDYRTVAGTLDTEPTLDAAVAEARINPAFLRLLVRLALRDEPPTGFIRKLVVQAKGEHAGTLDIKHGGILIVTSIARARAVAAGSAAKDTLGRLAAAEAGGTLRPESGADLAEAFRFLMDVRLRHQVTQVRAGSTPDDFVDPTSLGTIERSGLREAFRAIRGEQQLLALEHDIRV